jgi:hypothetical protein
MRKHFTLTERELVAKMTEGTVEQEDVEKASELARSTGRLDHIALYSSVKKSIKTED